MRPIPPRHTSWQTSRSPGRRPGFGPLAHTTHMFEWCTSRSTHAQIPASATKKGRTQEGAERPHIIGANEWAAARMGFGVQLANHECPLATVRGPTGSQKPSRSEKQALRPWIQPAVPGRRMPILPSASVRARMPDTRLGSWHRAQGKRPLPMRRKPVTKLAEPNDWPAATQGPGVTSVTRPFLHREPWLETGHPTNPFDIAAAASVQPTAIVRASTVHAGHCLPRSAREPPPKLLRQAGPTPLGRPRSFHMDNFAQYHQ